LNRAFLTIMTLALVSVTLPLAVADETKADCEPGQQWAGYATSDPNRVLIESLLGQENMIEACEGEQWDGQDSVEPAYNPGTGSDCTVGVTNADPNDLFVGSCMAPDPNSGGADPLAGNGQPVTFRVSKHSGSDSEQVYVAADIALVGRAATYAGECGDGGSGLEGSSSCASGGEQRAGVYLRDNTLGNLLAQAVSAPGITKGHVSEGDCSQSLYAQGANSGDRTLCGRDNTAVGVQLIGVRGQVIGLLP
jgi:hypothetical protein